MQRIRDILNQLLDVYYLREDWQEDKMIVEEARKYHKKLLNNGSIVCYEENGELLGYYELWKITSEQLEQIVTNRPFSAYLRNINDGNIAYLANIWIKKDRRQGHVIRVLKSMWLKHTKGCTHCTGQEAKRNNRLRVFENKRS